jgi:hypothetical protein
VLWCHKFKVFQFEKLTSNMLKQALIAFFKPSLPIIIMMGIFLSISIPAQFQRWSMEEQIMGVPKPAFYDELQPYPFIKLIYSWFMIPAAFIGVTTRALADNGIPIALPTLMFTPAGGIFHAIYFYILACIVGLFWRNMKANGAWHERPQKVRSA